MITYHKDYQQDTLSEMLRQFPLEEPPRDFTEKVMSRIQIIGAESKVYFYQKPLFISILGILFAACFLLFYHADFSFSILLGQLENYYDICYQYIVSLKFMPRKITFSPMIVAPLLLLGCIFIADRALEVYKKRKKLQVFCI